jgi:hypothetical protein
MESQLLERIYSGNLPASTVTAAGTLPLAYEQAFGAFARRACDILAPEDFARGLVYFEGMDFQGFVVANRIELLDDDSEPPTVTTVNSQWLMSLPAPGGM